MNGSAGPNLSCLYLNNRVVGSDLHAHMMCTEEKGVNPTPCVWSLRCYYNCDKSYSKEISCSKETSVYYHKACADHVGADMDL